MVGAIQSRTEFASALNQVCAERGIEPEVVIESIKAAILAAFKKDFPQQVELIVDQYDAPDKEELSVTDIIEEVVTVDIDPASGATKLVKEIAGEKADITPPGFGRIAAQTAKQVILQRVREAEKDAIIAEYQDKVGAMITGMVLRFDGKNVIFDIGRGQGYMPPEEQIRGEFYKTNQRLAIYVKEIRDTMRGRTIIISRSSAKLVEELFKREVPEVASGAVEIISIAREAGVRTKIAVHSEQTGVDPVGSCVGQKGVRVQEVINELNNEKIDIIQYSEDPKMFLAAALAPAENLDIEIDDDKMTAAVTVPDDQLSLAIGKGGQNVRLAAKLTGYKIDIIGASGSTVTADGSEEDELDKLKLTRRVKNLLAQAGVISITAIKKALEKETLADIDGMGEVSIAEITEAVETWDKEQAAADEEVTESTDADETEETEETEEAEA